MARVWTAKPNPFPTGEYGVQVAYGNGIFCVLGTDGRAYVSADLGDTWSSYSMGFTGTREEMCMAFNGDVFCAISRNTAQRRVSADGVTWVGGTMPMTCFEVMAVDGVFYATGPGGIARSANGATWTTQPAVIFDNKNLAYGNGLFLLSGSSNFIATSPDAVTWTQHDLGWTDTYRFAWDGTSFVAIRLGSLADYAVHTSNDGISWSAPIPGLFSAEAAGSSQRNVVVDAGEILLGGYNRIHASEAGAGNPWVASTTPASPLSAFASGAKGGGVVMYITQGSTNRAIVTTPSLEIPPGAFWTQFVRTVEVN